jgi:ubiquinone/menaquinone biosynthesis C-methylase UbiE
MRNSTNLDKGEDVDPMSYYFLMNPMFEPSSKKYDWMNRIISVGIGQRLTHEKISMAALAPR